MTAPTPIRPTYRPGSAAAAFARITGGENPHVALGDFLDDWRRTPMAERSALVANPIADAGADLSTRRWAALFAAAVEHLCVGDGLAVPGWVGRKDYRLAEPWFLVPGTALRAWLLVSTPVPFKMRNVFAGDTVLSRA